MGFDLVQGYLFGKPMALRNSPAPLWSIGAWGEVMRISGVRKRTRALPGGPHRPARQGATRRACGRVSIDFSDILNVARAAGSAEPADLFLVTTRSTFSSCS